MASVRTDAELTPSTARVGTSSPEPCGNGEESNNLELCAGPSPATLSGLAAANGVSLKTDGGFGIAPASQHGSTEGAAVAGPGADTDINVWLDGVKTGYSRFAKAFDNAGIEDVHDLRTAQGGAAYPPCALPVDAAELVKMEMPARCDTNKCLGSVS